MTRKAKTNSHGACVVRASRRRVIVASYHRQRNARTNSNGSNANASEEERRESRTLSSPECSFVSFRWCSSIRLLANQGRCKFQLSVVISHQRDRSATCSSWSHTRASILSPCLRFEFLLHIQELQRFWFVPNVGVIAWWRCGFWWRWHS